MILLETDDLYYNTQVYFRNHCWDNMPNNDRVWAKRYHKWLADQGCVVVHTESTIPVVRNSLNVAPGFDQFGFERPEDALIFALRWT